MSSPEEISKLSQFWQEIDATYRADETLCVESVLEMTRMDRQSADTISRAAIPLINNMRGARKKNMGIDAFLFEYDLSTDEGISLMCLAEALLRIPDNKTRERLINDKISDIDWRDRLGQSDQLFVNAATWGLMLTGNIMRQPPVDSQALGGMLDRVLKRGGRNIIMQAMKILGKQFVLGRDIDEALTRARKQTRQGYRYSFDMLGEAAITEADAKIYFDAYALAIKAIGAKAQHRGPIHASGISIKLSALHPRYEVSQQQRVLNELYPRLRDLVLMAKIQDIGVTIDAEEAARLTLSLSLFEKLLREPELAGWDGLGLAVQSYQKRAPAVIDWLAELAKQTQHKIMIRLIKGAYWDTEIKDSQVEGYEGYPVFTRKVATDVSFLACARKIIDAGDAFYPQFATHNAHTVAAVLHFLEGRRDFEFQCLHGMGQSLYDQLTEPEKGVACRIYAPVGEHEQLLPYLVRRLLENGANSSFVNRIHDASLSSEVMAADPVSALHAVASKPHPNIPLPDAIYRYGRLNSPGIDFSHQGMIESITADIHQYRQQTWQATPQCGATILPTSSNAVTAVYSPADKTRHIVNIKKSSLADIEQALQQAQAYLPIFRAYSVETRAAWLDKMADLLIEHRTEFMAYCVYEAGKTIPDALAEVREAIDFCRYYALVGRQQLSQPEVLDAVTGENNCLTYHPRGIVVTISPWNFPLAIFLGQVTAALMAGNVVIAKPAEQTSYIAYRAVELLLQAGFPAASIQCCPGDGAKIGATLVSDPRVSAVMFTGSTETASAINLALAQKPGPITPLIAETGGQNAMIVDSSALLEQVVNDVVQSAFGSAGQRCSACRVVFVQAAVADRFLALCRGAMDELVVGDPENMHIDVGPVIDQTALSVLQAHITKMKAVAKACHQTRVPKSVLLQGYFIPPTLFEIDSINQLEREVFGPVLHVIRVEEGKLMSCLQQIHQTGYGLTMGLHSRVDSHIAWFADNAQVGNVYINRNMVGAVVGAQPFGGEGLSGTGPKAGGPNYLKRLCVERCVSTNTTATGGNASLLMLAVTPPAESV